jgi:hypothetical protein
VCRRYFMARADQMLGDQGRDRKIVLDHEHSSHASVLAESSPETVPFTNCP